MNEERFIHTDTQADQYKDERSMIPGLIACIVLQLIATGLLSLGRFLPVPLPWFIISMPIWIPPLTLIALAVLWKIMGGRVFK